MDDIKKILGNRAQSKKPPAYQWQDLALRIIKELNIPIFKRSSVFKVCKEHFENGTRSRIMQALTDTHELCQAGQKWQYFFKILSPKKEDSLSPKKTTKYPPSSRKVWDSNNNYNNDRDN